MPCRREPALTTDTPGASSSSGGSARIPTPGGDVPGSATPGTPGASAPRPGLRQQIGTTRAAAFALVHAHIELFKVEIGEILSLVKTISILAGIILVIALFTGNLVYVGTWLFLGEWLFGSLGWGVIHGLLFAVGLIVMLVLMILGAGVGRVLQAFITAAIVAVVLGLVLGSRIIPNTLDPLLAGQALTPLGVSLDPSVMAAAGIGALVLGVLGLLIGIRGGAGRAVGFLVLGVIGGALLGWIIGSRDESRFAWAFAVAVGLILWSVLQAVFARKAIDIQGRFGALKPTESIEAIQETREWLGQQWANRRSKLAKR